MSEEQQIPSVLACDVGNQAVHFAHVKGDEVTEPHVVRVGELGGLGAELLALWEQMPEPRKIVATSVNPAALKAVEAVAAEALRREVLVVGRDLPVPLETDLAEPGRIGTDRLCAAVAAFDRLGVPCVVADFGTAITIDCVDAEGRFLGGAILPGLEMSLRALHERTALLPQAEVASPDWVFGGNTDEAIVGGVVFGARGALRGLIESYATELGQWPTVIVTGGDAETICADDDTRALVQAIVPDLVLRGAAMAYYRTLLR